MNVKDKESIKTSHNIVSTIFVTGARVHTDIGCYSLHKLGTMFAIMQ